MRKIAIIGAGEFASQLQNFCYENTEFIFFDDNLPTNNVQFFNFNEYLNFDFIEYKVIIGLGYKHLQKKLEISNYLIKKNVEFYPIISSNNYIDKTAQLGQGNVLFPSAVLDFHTVLGHNNILNIGVKISHNTVIGDANYLSPSVTICGNVEIGNCNFIGAGSIVSNGIKIGNNCKIGIGSVITKNIPDNTSAIGNPSKIISSINLT